MDAEQDVAAIQAEKGDYYQPTEAEIAAVGAQRREAAAERLTTNTPLVDLLLDIHDRSLITYDEVSQDTLQTAGFDATATEQARQTVSAFQHFIAKNKDEITALRILFSRPYRQQPLTREMMKELAAALTAAYPQWTTRRLWEAYRQLEKDRVRGATTERQLADLVALVRYVVQPDDELRPFQELVHRRYEDWLAAQQAAGRDFTAQQRWWLDHIAEHIGVNPGH